MNAQTQPNPYAPPTANVGDFLADQPGFELAERGTRLGAYAIDSVLFLLCFVPLILSSFRFLMNANAAGVFSFSVPFALIGGLVLTIITIVLVHRNGQTIGKKMLGIKVVRSDGSRASLGRIFWLRNVVNALPSMIPYLGGVYFFIDSLFIVADNRQCLHDKIADTIVIKA
jgi:uncharacterized RDD family membrane protein YckC